MNMVVGIIVALLVLSALVLIHEAAHCLAARACGMRVTELFVGLPFGPRLSWKSPRSGIRYGATLALLGGYTKISGMAHQDDATGDAELAKALQHVEEAGETTVAQLADAMEVSQDEAGAMLDSLVEFGSVEPQVPDGISRGLPQRYSAVARDANGLTMRDYGNRLDEPGSVAVGQARPCSDPQGLLRQDLSHTYDGAGFWRRAVVLVAGVAANIVFAILVVSAFFMVQGGQIVSSRVEQVVQDSIAQAAGVQQGDEIVSIAGHDVTGGYDQLNAALSDALAQGDPFEVGVSRAGERLDLLADPATSFDHGKLGVFFGYDRVPLGPVQALGQSLDYAGATAGFIAQLLIPSHTMEVLGQSAGIVGIVSLSGQAAQGGVWAVVSLMAALSLSLGWMNLIPLPPLDGGKLVIEIVQALIRRKVSLRVQTAISMAGMALLVLLFVYMVGQDFTRIFSTL